MADLITVTIDGSESIEFAASGTEGPQAYSTSATVAKAAETLDSVLEKVKRLGTKLGQTFSEIRCDSAEATFGIKVTGKGNFIVAEAGTTASLQIKIRFKRA
jgi:Trypsin-co-occurring domain 1